MKNFFKNKNNLQKISVCLGILKGVISLALLTSIGTPDFKIYDAKIGKKY
jgi:hypothetical protein